MRLQTILEKKRLEKRRKKEAAEVKKKPVRPKKTTLPFATTPTLNSISKSYNKQKNPKKVKIVTSSEPLDKPDSSSTSEFEDLDPSTASVLNLTNRLTGMSLRSRKQF